MTAGYHESDEPGGNATRSTARPGPLPPRTEYPVPGQPPAPYPTAAIPAQATAQYPAQPGIAAPAPYPGQPAQYPASAVPAHHPASAVPAHYPASAVPAHYPASAVPAHYPASAVPASGGPYLPVSGGPYQPAAGAPARRSPLLAVLVIVLLVLAAVQGVGLIALNGKVGKERDARRTAQTQDGKRIADLQQRASALEKQAAASLDPQAVAAAVLPSVFKVEAGDFSGTAFVVANEAGSSSLLTNYHVVAELYEGGGRTVSLVHDNQRFSAKISKVDSNADLALLTTGDKFPALATVKNDVATGAPVVVIGAPLGLAQSVTTGVVSAIRNDVPGEAGRTYIQFSAPINPGNSGGPVVDAQKEVVGIATAKAQDAEGIGLAIPISVACKSFSVC